MADTKTVDLGSVGIVNGHTYSETTTYNSNTFVKYKESTWLCIKDGTVGIEPNYANTSNWQAMAIGIDQYTTESQKAAKEAKSYAIGNTSTRDGEDTDNAKYYSEQAKSYAIGNTSTRDGEDTDNAKYYSEQAKASEEKAAASEVNADMYKKDAATSAANAKASEDAAKLSEINAKDSETAAKSSETNAKASEVSAIDAANRANKIANDLTGTLKPVSENIRADAIHYEDNHNINADSVQTAIDKILSGEALQIDSALSATSENPVQNKIITNQISTLNQALTAVQSNIASMSEKTEDPFNVTIPSNAWTSSAPYTNNVSVTGKGITSEKSYEILGFVPTGTKETDIAQKEALGCITYGMNDTDSMTFIALEDKPSADVTVTMRRCK